MKAASLPYTINYSLQTTLNPTDKKLLAYQRWHGALSTLPGAIRDKDGEKEKCVGEKDFNPPPGRTEILDEDKGRNKRMGAMLYWRPDVCSRVRDSVNINISTVAAAAASAVVVVVVEGREQPKPRKMASHS